MNVNDLFAEELNAFEHRLADLTRRARAARSDEALTLLQEAAAELETSREDVRQQRDELIATRGAIEAEALRYQELFLEAPDAYIVTDSDGAIRHINRAGHDLLAHPGEYAGKPLAASIAEQDLRRFRTALASTLRGAVPGVWRTVIRQPDGTEVPVTVTSNAITGGTAVHGVRWLMRPAPDVEPSRAVVAGDIGGAAPAYREILDLIPSPACVFSADGAIVYANLTWRDYTGLSPEELAARGWRAVVDPRDLGGLLRLNERCTHDPAPGECEFGLRRRDGIYRRHRSRFRPMLDASGGVTGWVAVTADVEDEHETDAQLRSLYADARQAVDRLRDSVAMKDEFLGLMSHELKGPITTVLGNSEVLLKHDRVIDDDSRVAALRDIHNDAERLYHIIEDLLSLSRLEHDGGVALEPLMLGHVVEAIVNEHRRRYPTRPFTFAIEAEAGPVLGERVYIEQVLRNLLSNAEKYSPRDLPIEVRMRTVSREAEVTIADRGPGLSEDESRRVFEPFVRLSRTSSSVSGSGIGLTVCRRLIEAQSGRIAARPRDGGGSEFSFAIPLADEAADEE